MEIIKNIISKVFVVLFYLLRVFRIDNKKILIMNFNGRGYSDNPKYIAEKLRKKKVNIVWGVSKKDDNIPSDIKQVKYQSLRWIYEMCTSRIWINNCRFPAYVRKRRGQYYIQLWHNGGILLKRIEFDVEKELPRQYVKRMKNDTMMTDLMISDGKECTKMYRRAFRYSGKIIELGLPRNDELVNNKDLLSKKARKALMISNDKKILLYAPTFRKDYSHNPYDIDLQSIKKILEKKYKCEWEIIIKLHPNVSDASKLIKDIDLYTDGKKYDNTQELICASNLLITDYSGTMAEGMIANVPVVLYANDADEYSKDRGMYTKLEDLPFPLCTSNVQLMEYLKNNSVEAIVNGYGDFEKKIGLMVDGESDEKIAEIVIKEIKEE